MRLCETFMAKPNSSSLALPSKLSATIPCKQAAVRAVRFNVDGNYCITCGGDKTLKLWNPHKGEAGFLLKTYTGHGYEVLDACGSCDNAQIVSGGADKQIFVWDVTTGKPIRKFRGHAGRVNAVTFNEESTVVFSASLDTTAKAWDCKSKAKEPIQVFDEAKDNVTCIAVTPHEILTGSADNQVRRYDLRTGRLLEDFVGASVTSASFTRDGQYLLVSSLDSTVRLLDKDTGELLADYTGHKNLEYKIDSTLNHTDSQVFSGSEDSQVYVWDLVESKLLGTIEHPQRNSVVHSLSYHPKSNCLVTALLSNVYVWKEPDAKQRSESPITVDDDY